VESKASRLRHTFTQGMHTVQKSCTLACMHDGTGLATCNLAPVIDIK
jgi:hypothetical protein